MSALFQSENTRMKKILEDLVKISGELQAGDGNRTANDLNAMILTISDRMKFLKDHRLDLTPDLVDEHIARTQYVVATLELSENNLLDDLSCDISEDRVVRTASPTVLRTPI